MTVEVKVPQLPESVTDATLVSWHKAPGQAVKRDENLVDLETDKVVLEVPAPVNGVIKEIQIDNGATVTSTVSVASTAIPDTAARLRRRTRQASDHRPRLSPFNASDADPAIRTGDRPGN